LDARAVADQRLLVGPMQAGDRALELMDDPFVGVGQRADERDRDVRSLAALGGERVLLAQRGHDLPEARLEGVRAGHPDALVMHLLTGPDVHARDPGGALRAVPYQRV